MRTFGPASWMVATFVSFGLAASHTDSQYGPFSNSPFPPVNNTFYHEAVMDQEDIDYWPQVEGLEFVVDYLRNGVPYTTANEEHDLPIRGGVWDITLKFPSGSPVPPNVAGSWVGASFLAIDWVWCDTGQYPPMCFHEISCNYELEPCYDSAAGTIN